MRSRALIVTLLVCLAALLLLPAAAAAWSNGDDYGNGFGTHDWVLQEANRLAARQGAGWVILKIALPKTDDPDTVFHDTYYHVYDVWGSHYGDAPKKVMEYYGKALAARKAGNWTAASKYAGLMAHYYADICNPLHTDQTRRRRQDALVLRDGGAEVHRRARERTARWVTFDGYKATTDVVAFTKTTATASHKSYAALVKRLQQRRHERHGPVDHQEGHEPRRQRARRPPRLDQEEGPRQVAEVGLTPRCDQGAYVSTGSPACTHAVTPPSTLYTCV